MANQNRLERLVADLKEFDEDIAELKRQRAERVKEAKKEGFPMKVIEKHLKREKMDPEKREEEDALLEIVEAQLGKRDGVPLSERALRRLDKQREDDRQMALFDQEDAASAKAVAPVQVAGSDDNEDEARAKGAAAAQAGVKVTANPYPPRSALRAAWDEAWCQAAGSDGMEIPAAFKPTPKPKKPKKGEGDGEPGGDE